MKCRNCDRDFDPEDTLRFRSTFVQVASIGKARTLSLTLIICPACRALMSTDEDLVRDPDGKVVCQGDP